MKLKSLLLAFFLCVFSVYAQESSKSEYIKINESTYCYTLDNGITLFVAENHSVPLAYVEIAVRAGGITQTKENAGLFHLYEHINGKEAAMETNTVDWFSYPRMKTLIT